MIPNVKLIVLYFFNIFDYTCVCVHARVYLFVFAVTNFNPHKVIYYTLQATYCHSKHGRYQNKD